MSRPVLQALWLTASLTLACADTTEPGPSVATVQLTAPNVSLLTGDSAQWSATARDAAGNIVNGRAISWTSNAPGVATVSATGLVRGVSAGSATISATAEGKSGATQVAVIIRGTPAASAVGPTGGTVQATAHGGSQVTLTIPAGALAATAQMTIDTMRAPEGAALGLRLGPRGLSFAIPADLEIALPAGVPARRDMVLAFAVGALQVALPTQVDTVTRHLTVRLDAIGLTDDQAAVAGVSPGIMAALANDSLVDLLVLTMDLDRRIQNALLAVVELERLGTFAASEATFIAMRAVIEPDAAAALQAMATTLAAPVTRWRLAVCNELSFALNAFRSFNFTTDFVGLRNRGRNLLGWGVAANDLANLLNLIGEPGCQPPPQVDAIAEYVTRVDSLIPTWETEFAAAFDPRVLSQARALFRDRLRPIVDMAADLAQVSEDVLRAKLEALVGREFTRMRVGAYDACRLDKSQVPQQDLLTRETGDGSVEVLTPYDASDLRNDVAYCGFTLQWRIEDSSQAALASGTLGGGTAPASFAQQQVVPFNRSATVKLTGNMRPLICPTGSQNNEQLVITAQRVDKLGFAPAEVGRVTAPGNLQYLDVNPLALTTAQLRTAAGLGQLGGGTIRVRLARTGGVCAGAFVGFAHQPLVNLDIAYPTLQITTTALPDGFIGSPYSRTLSAVNGNGTYAWSRTQGTLPPGLSLSGSGVISGTPTTVGTQSFTVFVESGGDTDDQSLTIVTRNEQFRIDEPNDPMEIIEVGNLGVFFVAAVGCGSTVQWSLQGVPTGWTIESQFSSAKFSGPISPGTTYDITVTARCGTLTDTQGYRMTVLPPG